MRTLISGGSVAGPALAYWLRRHGISATVVERAPGPRPGGQALDVRGAALTVIERMGLLDRLRAVRTRMAGMSVLDSDGEEIMRSTERTGSSGKLDNGDVEVLREDLVALLAEHTADVDYRYGDSIVALEPGPGGVDVTFRNGPPDRFDIVVGADGLHSATRRLAFGPEEQFSRYLGSYLAVFTAPNDLGLDDWQVWMRTDTAGAAIYPARDNSELRVLVGFSSPLLDIDHHDVEAQRRLVAESAAVLGWEIPELLKAMWHASDFYFDAMAQIRMDTWSRGPVTLLGDAGYCSSPMSGQGTSLALVGAYVLAEELAREPADAFARYERRMRPFAEANQDLVLENPGYHAPEESLDRAKNAIAL